MSCHGAEQELTEIVARAIYEAGNWHHDCPWIDKVIVAVRQAQQLIVDWNFCDASLALDNVEDHMESLRTANTRLRALACEYLGEIERLNKEYVCSVCEGSGWDPDLGTDCSPEVKCRECSGTGRQL